MKFLKASIFYPKELNEVSLNKMQEARKRYDSYLFQIKEKYNVELMGLYNRTAEFHDYRVINLDFIIGGLDENEVSLFIKGYEEKEEYGLVFEGVSEFKVNGIICDTEDITLCEIGIVKKLKYIYFHLANGAEIEIKFKNVIIS